MAKTPRQAANSSALAALSALDPTAERSVQSAAVKKALEDRHFQVVAKGATLAGDRSLHECMPDLLSAYTRFLQDPIKRDPGCIAKQAIARALVALQRPAVAFFLEGILYTQHEPVWGGTTDTAIDVRCSCAMGLAASGYPRAVAELTALLNDPEARVRAGAVRAISCANPHEAEVLLRFKALTGDTEPEVIGECFTGLLAIAPKDCLTFVAGYLKDADNAIREYAALALGESRHPEALGHLRAAWDEMYVTPEVRATLIRSGALHRTEAAFDWLISIIEHGTRAQADIVADALAVYERNSKLIERVQSALAKRRDA
jgi:HEAT repeat protein